MVNRAVWLISGVTHFLDYLGKPSLPHKSGKLVPGPIECHPARSGARGQLVVVVEYSTGKLREICQTP